MVGVANWRGWLWNLVTVVLLLVTECSDVRGKVLDIVVFILSTALLYLVVKFDEFLSFLHKTFQQLNLTFSVSLTKKEPNTNKSNRLIDLANCALHQFFYFRLWPSEFEYCPSWPTSFAIPTGSREHKYVQAIIIRLFSNWPNNKRAATLAIELDAWNGTSATRGKFEKCGSHFVKQSQSINLAHKKRNKLSDAAVAITNPSRLVNQTGRCCFEVASSLRRHTTVRWTEVLLNYLGEAATWYGCWLRKFNRILLLLLLWWWWWWCFREIRPIPWLFRWSLRMANVWLI